MCVAAFALKMNLYSLPPLQLKAIKCKCHTSGHPELEDCLVLTAADFLHIYLLD